MEISWWLLKVCTLNECCNVGHGKCNCANKRVNLCNFACFLPELSTGLPFWWAVLHPLQTGSLNFSHPRNLLEFASEVPVGHHGAPFELKPFIHSIYIRIGKLLKFVHFKKTVARISILSKLWYTVSEGRVVFLIWPWQREICKSNLIWSYLCTH